MGRCFGKVRRDLKNGLARSGEFHTQQVESRRASGTARPLATSWWINSSRGPNSARLLSWVSRLPVSLPALLTRAQGWAMGIMGPSSHNGRFRWVASSLKVKTRDKVILSRALLTQNWAVLRARSVAHPNGRWSNTRTCSLETWPETPILPKRSFSQRRFRIEVRQEASGTLLENPSLQY